jgi:hypothetical protein
MQLDCIGLCYVNVKKRRTTVSIQQRGKHTSVIIEELLENSVVYMVCAEMP